MLAQLPNVLTLLRLLLVFPLIYFLLAENFQAAFFVLLAAGLSDFLDGKLARFFNCSSSFGSTLDPIADKILMTVSYLLLGYVTLLPHYVVYAVIARDIYIVLGVLAYRSVVGPYRITPSWMGKWTTFWQILLLVMALLVSLSEGTANWQSAMSQYLPLIIDMVVCFSLISALDYTMFWGLKAAKHVRHKQ